ncbi:MAG: Hsp20/alpha crystallin family protein [Telluria sp.]
MASNLTRFDPFGDLARLDPFRQMDEVMRELRPAWSMREGTAPVLRVDVSETDDAYQVKCDVPGVKKDDIKVDVSGNRVSITAECRRESDEKDKAGTLLRSERYYGQQSRSFTLDSDIDEARADARYEDGVLTLTLPKKPGNGSRKLPIH